MGYNTTVVVLNDALGFIENDPDFGKNLVRAILQVSNRGGSIDVAARHGGGIHCNAASVIESHHASGTEWVKVGQNCGSVIPFGDRLEAEKAIKRSHKRQAAHKNEVQK